MVGRRHQRAADARHRTRICIATMVVPKRLSYCAESCTLCCRPVVDGLARAAAKLCWTLRQRSRLTESALPLEVIEMP